jgi:GT2 family glycosyltransferase
MKILAAVVTFNRCELLSRCLDHVLTQTRPVNGVLVINNGSSDGTEEMLRSRGVSFITQENLGSAGGWHRAIAHAQQSHFDAVWLMDDDGFPDAEALEALAMSLKEDVACASSIVVCENDPSRFVFPFPRLNSAGFPVIWGWPRKIARVSGVRAIASSGSYPFAHLFNGALVSVKATRIAGNVNQGFFMFGDEVDYFFRLRGVGKVFSVLAARHFHPDVSRRPYTPVKVYYYIKNSITLNSRYFDHHWFRHAMVILAALGRVLRRNGPGMTLSLLAGSHRGTFYSAIVRGLKRQIGKDFNA